MSDNPEIPDDVQAELSAKWNAIEKQFNDAKMHLVCPKVLLLLLADDGVTFRKEWTKPMVAQFWKVLEPTVSEKTHRKAIEDLIYVASFVHHKLDRLDVAMGLLVLLNEAVEKYKLIDLDVQAKFDGSTGDEAVTARVTGGKSRPIPAKVGEGAPAGSVRPDKLGGKRRI